MLLKSLLTGVVLAGLAGGVVYFGTGANMAGADVRNAVAEVKSETAKVTENVTSNVKDKIDDIRTQTGLVEANKNEADVKLAEVKDVPGRVDDIEAPKTDDKIKFDITEQDMAETNISTPAIDVIPSEEIAIIETPVLAEEPVSKNWFGRFFDNQKAKREAARDERAKKLGIDRDEGAAQKYTKEASLKSSVIDRGEGLSGDITLDPKDVQAVYDTVLDQTDTIEIIELKDRAYLSLIDYTIRNQAFDKSKSIVPLISQPELRDTARSNIAVGYARLGQRENAFDVLQNVEIEALSDVLRLQVIEAMTAPAQ